MLLLILIALCFPHFGLKQPANTIIAVVLVILGFFVVFVGWPDVRVDVSAMARRVPMSMSSSLAS
jgi:hypothetical protein